MLYPLKYGLNILGGTNEGGGILFGIEVEFCGRFGAKFD